VSGYAVGTELAAQSHTRHIRVVVVTGNEPDAPLDVSCLLRKPVTPDKLVEAVHTCLEKTADRQG
jgi:CheY-like chemotaxis protein